MVVDADAGTTGKHNAIVVNGGQNADVTGNATYRTRDGVGHIYGIVVARAAQRTVIRNNLVRANRGARSVVVADETAVVVGNVA